MTAGTSDHEEEKNIASQAKRFHLPGTVSGLFTQVGLQARSLALAMRNHYHAMFVAVLIVLLLLPMQSYPGNFNDFPKMFWGYDSLIRLYNAARYFLIKDEIYGNAFVRPGPWLVYTGESSLDDFQNNEPFKADELSRIQQNLDGLDERLKAKGIHFLLVIVPGKNTIYPEYMPPQVPILKSQSRTDQVLAYEQQHGHVDILDLRPALRAARQQHQVFYATDTHWNQYGILAGYTEIIRTLQKDFPNLRPHSLDDFKVVPTDPYIGDLSSVWINRFAQEDSFRLEPRFDRQVNQYILTQGSGTAMPGRVIVTTNPDSRLPRAVIYHDSFMNAMIPFLSDHLSWAVFYWTFSVDEDFVAGAKPDIVIFEVTDRYLSRLLTVTK